MARWRKPLPDAHDPAVVQFVVRLRQMKDDSGLTLQQLAARTGYSASSWERYLGGRLLAPAEAVEALARVVDADPVRLLARHAQAADAWQDPRPEGAAQPEPETGADSADEGPSAPAEPEPEPAPQPEPEPEAGAQADAGATGGTTVGRALPPVLRYVLTAVVSAIGGAGIALLIAQGVSGHTTVHAAPVYRCDYTLQNGLWYSGNSTTTTNFEEVDDNSYDIAELQCLLQHAHFSPGAIDGNFGPLTELALIRFQQARHLEVDGQVGPQTWKALRG